LELQKVYYEEDYGMGCGYKKVGLRIGDQIVWFASWNYPGKPDELNNFRRMEALIVAIIERYEKQEEKKPKAEGDENDA